MCCTSRYDFTLEPISYQYAYPTIATTVPAIRPEQLESWNSYQALRYTWFEPCLREDEHVSVGSMYVLYIKLLDRRAASRVGPNIRETVKIKAIAGQISQ